MKSPADTSLWFMLKNLSLCANAKWKGEITYCSYYEFVAGQVQADSATGEEAAEMFDLDISL
ncbi:MAG: hypothetical protein PHY50_04580 [Sideroxydans sp.]|nr:hypothetical protein [Sideroxydans sp.]